MLNPLKRILNFCTALQENRETQNDPNSIPLMPQDRLGSQQLIEAPGEILLTCDFRRLKFLNRIEQTQK